MAAFSDEEIKIKLKNFDDWKYQNEKIEKEFEFKDFKQALSFVNKVGDIAEDVNHHPDIFLHSWNKVKISVATHDENGITSKDFDLAKKIESI